MTASKRWMVAMFCGALAACSSGGSDPKEVAELALGFLGDATVVDAPSDRGDVAMACSGGIKYLAWEDGVDDVYFCRSLDGGLTWSTPVQLDTSDDEDDADDPRMQAFGNTVYVYWKDDRTGWDDVYLQVSFDGGVTWQAEEIRVSHSPNNHSENPTLCTNGADVYMAWQNDLNDNDSEKRVYMNRSADGGLTWLADDIRVEQDDVNDADSENPKIVCQGQTIVVVWEDKRNGGGEDVYMNRSTDGGDTWLAADVRLDVNDAESADAEDLRVCASGSYIYVAWTDDRAVEEHHDSYLAVSTDFGSTWSEDKKVNALASDLAECFELELCCSGDHVYVSWVDDRRLPERNIYIQVSHDAGQTWQPEDIRIDDGPFSADERDLHCSGNVLVMIWEDNRDDEAGDVYGSISVDGGLTWLTPVRVDAEPPGGDDPDDHLVCIDDGEIVFLWDYDGDLTARSARIP